EEEEIPKEKEIRDSSDVDELIHVIGTTIHLGEKLSIEIKRIKELERQWEEIIVNDSKELEKKQQYINKYGDFTTTTKEGQEFVDKLHNLYQIAIEKLQKISPEDATHVESWEQIMHSDSAPRPIITNSSPLTTTIPTTIPTINASIPISTSTLNSLNSYPVPSITATTTYSLPAPIVEPSQVSMTEGIPTLYKNYAVARQVLSQAYGGSLRLKNTLLQQLKDLPSIHLSRSPKDLQTFCNSASKVFHQLTSLDCQMDNMMTAALLTSKLPKRILAKLYANDTDSPLSAGQLITQLSSISTRENVVDDMYISNHKDEFDKNRSLTTMSAVAKHRPNNHHQHQDISYGSPKLCEYCASPRMHHRSHDCRQYKTKNERKQRANELKLCYRCLQSGHSAKFCRQQCTQCRGGHHLSLCRKILGAFNDSTFGNSSSAPGQQQRDFLPNTTGRGQGFQPQQVTIWNNQQQRRPNYQPNQQFQSNQNQQPIQQNQRQQHQQPFRAQGRNTNNFQPRGGNNYQHNRQGTGQPAMVTQAVDTSDETAQLPTSQDARNHWTTETYQVDQLSTLEIVADHGSDLKDIPDKESEAPLPAPVIMMTAEINIVDTEGVEKLATVFFDSGSNTSYISEKFTKGLALDTIGKKKMTVHTFGTKEATHMNSRVLKAILKLNNEHRAVHLCEVSHIASSIMTAPINTDMVKALLEGREEVLVRSRKEVDILIGMDLLMELLGEVKTIHLQNGLHLHLTKCGPIVSGKENRCRTESSTSRTTEASRRSRSDKRSFGNFLERKMDATPFDYRSAFRNIPVNRHLAFFRLLGTMKRLQRDEKLLEQYNKIFEEQLSLGFIEIVSDENHLDGKVVHYLAHHPVIKESSKSTQVRIVFDGSARIKKNERSLNDALHTGESLLPEIAGVMLRNRKPAILISADIKKAFLQLNLHVQDRDATRFLWISPEGDIICYRYKRVQFGLKSSPFLLNCTIKEHLAQYDCEFAKEMQRSIYVDNVYVGVNDEMEAQEFYKVSKKIFQDAQNELMPIPLEFNEQKLLGTPWNTNSDELILQLPQKRSGITSKRTVLKFIASCFDVLGLLAPVTLYGKLFFQELCKVTQSWDTPLSEELDKQWISIVEAWKGEPWKFPRQYFKNDELQCADRVELHIFTDASEKAFGAVGYLRIITKTRSAKSIILMAKCRVAPIRPQHSIPQLELIGVLTGVKLANYIIQELDVSINQTYLWTDSMCVLDMIQSQEQSKNKFVRNRIRLIDELSEDFIFSHIPGVNNPADLVTRGMTFEEIKSCDKWIHGPQFLQSLNDLPLRQSSQEKKANSLTLMTVNQETKEPIIDPHRFSSFHRMIRTVMTILHFLTRKTFNFNDHASKARKIIYQTAQLIHPPTEDCIETLRLVKTDGLWTYSGRVENKPLVYLPHGRIAALLIMEIHQQHMHSSAYYTLSRLRETIWIVKGRSFVNKVIKSCTRCEKRNNKPYLQPPFAPFPVSRYTPSRPFENIGTDYAGPFNVKVGQQITQCWFILFTCLYSRYTVVEVVLNMDAETFLHCLRRLSATFGIPKNIVSDNGTQFVMMTKVVEIVKEQHRQIQLNSVRLPKFHQIPAHSPWAGGVYERIIGLIKESLKRTGLTRQLLSLEEFQTTLAECVSNINMRPISYVAEDDDIKPLRPMDFVFPDSNLNHQLDIQPIDLDNIPRNRSELIENWSRSSSLTDHFRRRWSIEYPQILQERREFLHRQKHASQKKPSVGDIVLIEQKDVDKNRWTMARVIETKARSAVIKNGATKRKGEYPFNKLFPVETEIAEEVEPDEVPSSINNDSSTNQPPMRRSARLAALPSLLAIALLLPIASADNNTTEEHQFISQFEETYTAVNTIVTPITMMILGILMIFVLGAVVKILEFAAKIIQLFVSTILFGCWIISKFVKMLLKIRSNKRLRQHNFIFALISLTASRAAGRVPVANTLDVATKEPHYWGFNNSGDERNRFSIR
uniref:CCHC-type domain-containing protein n=1 Tax=Caenorhabditis tropicalis TaxID=1561998 RepID=A0A1I7T3X2_9PELO